MAEIDGKPVTERVYLDRYLPAYPVYPSYPYWRNSMGVGTCNAVGVNSAQQYAQAAQGNNLSNQIGSGGLTFNSLQAMTDLGRAESAKLAA